MVGETFDSHPDDAGIAVEKGYPIYNLYGPSASGKIDRHHPNGSDYSKNGIVQADVDTNNIPKPFTAKQAGDLFRDVISSYGKR